MTTADVRCWRSRKQDLSGSKLYDSRLSYFDSLCAVGMRAVSVSGTYLYGPWAGWLRAMTARCRAFWFGFGLSKRQPDNWAFHEALKLFVFQSISGENVSEGVKSRHQMRAGEETTPSSTQLQDLGAIHAADGRHAPRTFLCPPSPP